MRYVLVRDDDLNYFTPFSQLETVYGFMFDQEIPVNFSTIPAVNASAITKDHETGETAFEPFLPKDVAGISGNFELDQNTELLAKLNTMQANEYLHHGFEHSGTDGLCEFETRDSKLLSYKLERGRQILTRCFGQTPRTFVAPQDKYSREAIELIQSRFDTFSLGWIDRSRLPPSLFGKYACKKLFKRNHLHHGNLLMTEHPGCHYSRYVPRSISDPKLDAHLAQHDFTIIVTHHWEFFEGGKLIKSMWDAFKSRIQALHADPNTRLIRFSELYRLASA